MILLRRESIILCVKIHYILVYNMSVSKTVSNLVILLCVVVPLAHAACATSASSNVASASSRMAHDAAFVSPRASTFPSLTADAVSSVVVAGAGFTNMLTRTAEARWSGCGVTLTLAVDGQISVAAPATPLLWVELRWSADWPVGARVLCDAWERAYGELGWRDISKVPLFSPWCFLISAEDVTDGCGVEVQPNALAGWRLEKGALALRLDVSAGGDSVELGSRALDAEPRHQLAGVPFHSGSCVLRAGCRLLRIGLGGRHRRTAEPTVARPARTERDGAFRLVAAAVGRCAFPHGATRGLCVCKRRARNGREIGRAHV